MPREGGQKGKDRAGRLVDVEQLKKQRDDGFNDELVAEFELLSPNIPRASVWPQSVMSKNRYRNIIPHTSSAVSLSELADVPDSTYINANFVRGYGKQDKAFIAAQGPTKATVWDFWRMVYEQRCPVIVMMTGLVEKGKAKCERYWPEDGESSENEHFKVTADAAVDCGDYLFTPLTITKTNDYSSNSDGAHSSSDPDEFKVAHFWFTGWPDHGVPGSTAPVLEFILGIRQYLATHSLTETGPQCVHCSAGIGRTGTYMMLDICMHELQSEWRVCDVFGNLARMRNDRGGAVQTASQYFFIYKALADYVTPGNKFSMFGENIPRDIGLIKGPSESFGFTMRGCGPPFIVKLDPNGVAKKNGMKLADHVLAVNQQDTSGMAHKDVVELVRQSGEVVTLTVLSKVPLPTDK